MVNKSSEVFIGLWSTLCSHLFWDWLLHLSEYSTLRDPLSIPTPSSGRWSLSSSPPPCPACFPCFPGWGRGQGLLLMGVKSEQMPAQQPFLLLVLGGDWERAGRCLPMLFLLGWFCLYVLLLLQSGHLLSNSNPIRKPRGQQAALQTGRACSVSSGQAA